MRYRSIKRYIILVSYLYSFIRHNSNLQNRYRKIISRFIYVEYQILNFHRSIIDTSLDFKFSHFLEIIIITYGDVKFEQAIIDVDRRLNNQEFADLLLSLVIAILRCLNDNQSILASVNYARDQFQTSICKSQQHKYFEN